MNIKKPYRFILSGGGTGGHIYPAIAIADELKSRYPDAEFLFVGASDRMEMDKVPQAGYKIEGLWISGIQRKLTLRNLMFPIKLLTSLLRSRKIIKTFKPDVVIGTGGFASGPLLQIATSKRIPSLIQEQNSYPGITNKLLGKRVDTICVAYEGLETFFPKEKIRLTGNPIRKDLLKIKDKHIEGKNAFALIHSKHTLLVLGGSLGARRINEFIASKLDFFETHNVQLIWQCGKLYYDQYKHYNELKHVQVHAFLNHMDMAYAAADVIISRAGAISVSELCIVGKPTIFIPSPNVAEDHQTKNAKAVADKNAAILIREKDLELQFQNQFSELMANDERRKALSHSIEALALADATNAIVDEVEKLLNKAHLPSSRPRTANSFSGGAREETSELKDWYVELRDNEIKNYGEVRPPWIYAPKSHPASMRWRMGDGETHLSVLWKWLDEKGFSQDEKLEYAKRHNPPPRWMAWVSNFIWDIEDGYEADFDFTPYFEKLKEYGFQNVDNYESDYDDNQWE